MYKINQNLEAFTSEYKRVIDGLEQTLAIVTPDEDIERLQGILDDMGNLSLYDMLDLEDLTYTQYHILMSIWNIYQLVVTSPEYEETQTLLYELYKEKGVPYEIVWKNEQFQLQEIPELDLDEEEEELVDVADMEEIVEVIE